MKKMNKKGFTLMEMLIVIAIIAILIAIAIPTFTSALEKSKQKTDLANARALKSLVVSEYMLAEEGCMSGIFSSTTTSATFYLNKNGQEILTTETDGVKTAVTTAPTGDDHMKVTAKWDGETGDTKGAPISVTISDAGLVTAAVPSALMTAEE